MPNASLPRFRRRRLLWLTSPASVAEAGVGVARHTRAWSVSATAVVADCRRLRPKRTRHRTPERPRPARDVSANLGKRPPNRLSGTDSPTEETHHPDLKSPLDGLTSAADTNSGGPARITAADATSVWGSICILARRLVTARVWSRAGDNSLRDGTRVCRKRGTVSRRRYVARGVPGGYRIWDNRGRRWWGDLYELCPDDLVAELNGQADHARITALMKRYRAQKR